MKIGRLGFLMGWAIFYQLTAYSQYESVWAFGEYAGLDFNTVPPTAIETSIVTSEGSASLCDEQGALRFYTDGFIIWDRNHNVMPNGHDLTNTGVSISQSTTQGTLIIPMPGSLDQYYVFSLGARESIQAGRLYYSIVDMSLNGGLGDVLSSAKGVPVDSFMSEHLTAVRGPDCNVWLLGVSFVQNTLNAYEVGINGLASRPVTSALVLGGGQYGGFLGSLAITPDLETLAIARGNLVLYNFDRNTGMATNPRMLEDALADCYGASFSGDNSKLYATGGNAGLLQFDLSLSSTAQIIDSRTALGAVGYASLRRAENGKIYCTNTGRASLHVIHEPSLAGIACRFERNGVTLLAGSKSLLGLPNSVVHKPVRVLASLRDTTICNDAPFTLSASNLNGNNYQWNDSSDGPMAAFHGSGTYWVRYNLEDSAGCYTAIDSFQILQLPRNLDIQNGDTTVCEGASVSIQATGSSDFQYQWQPATGVSDPTALDPDITPVDTFTYYTITGSHPACPDTTVGIHIRTQAVPELTLAADKAVCYGEFVALESLVRPYRSDYRYTWSPAAGLQHAHTPNNAFIADSSITYSLEVTSPIGCKDSARMSIEVYPPDFATAVSDTGFCPPSGGLFLWAAGGDTFRWTPAYGLDDAGSATPFASPATPTLYTVRVTNAAGCVDSQEVFVDVYPNAVIYLPDSVTIYPGESYVLESQSNAHYFEWFPVSGIRNARVSNPEFFPEVRTRYFVNATTEQGCTVRDSIDILVNATVLAMPNAFKPGSGVNGVFKVEKRGIARLDRFAVYNRWGNKVFETRNIDEGWDGRSNTIPQPLGVYIYQIDAFTIDGEYFTRTGNVTLIR